MDPAAETPTDSPDAANQRVVMRLDFFRKLLDELDGNPRLQELFGFPVTSKLGVLADGNDLKIIDLEIAQLNEEQKSSFLEELGRILQKNIVEPEE